MERAGWFAGTPGSTPGADPGWPGLSPRWPTEMPGSGPLPAGGWSHHAAHHAAPPNWPRGPGRLTVEPPREPLVVSLAQGIVLLHAALLGMVTMMAFFGYLAAILDRTDRPVPLGLSLASLVGAPAVTAAVATIGVRLGPGRPWIWRGAILLGLAAAATYGWLAYTMVVAPSPEGTLALAGLMMGPPLVLGSLAGVGLLLTPRARAYCRDGR